MNMDFKHQFNEVCNELLQVISSIDEDDLNKAATDNTWSAGQIGEHLYKSYAVMDILYGTTKPANRPADEKVKEVRELFLDFNIKMESPKEILPSKKPKDKSWLLEALKGRIEQMKVVIEQKDLTKLCLDFAIPGYGEFTRLEWLHFNMVHTQRHVYQLKNLKEKLRYTHH